ncbi:hypothetical protein Q4603_21170 [Zobellia galactanivorans]|uniref:hypothetical protein n=1 Tax=Zobellia galactanivorans (strain DSM 12802 / CCUG 47099 / CIP 106680 / NCIMB 13871 / Dsij) TaxID=63186 RepID=UPI001C074BD5|nr:hypothetical protein [Zobellia galactanivorans]MBU3027048.1 hypothetical protein [Zobellia galactanivorans]MDO6811145.1 hypothetical protein [Zobellia galactanivorans]
MRKFVLALFTITMISCSSDNEKEDSEINIELTNEELLTQSNSWTFAEYRIDEILETNGVTLMDSDIENQILQENESFEEFTLSFQSSGNGTTNEPSNFQWELVTTELLRLTFGTEVDDYDFSITESEMILGIDDEFEYRVDENTIVGIEVRASIIFN